MSISLCYPLCSDLLFQSCSKPSKPSPHSLASLRQVVKGVISSFPSGNWYTFCWRPEGLIRGKHPCSQQVAPNVRGLDPVIGGSQPSVAHRRRRSSTWKRLSDPEDPPTIQDSSDWTGFGRSRHLSSRSRRYTWSPAIFDHVEQARGTGCRGFQSELTDSETSEVTGLWIASQGSTQVEGSRSR